MLTFCWVLSSKQDEKLSKLYVWNGDSTHFNKLVSLYVQILTKPKQKSYIQKFYNINGALLSFSIVLYFVYCTNSIYTDLELLTDCVSSTLKLTSFVLEGTFLAVLFLRALFFEALEELRLEALLSGRMASLSSFVSILSEVQW